MALRTYKGRTEEEQRAFNEERRIKLRKAREKAADSGRVESYAVDDDGFPELAELKAEINVEPIEIPQLSWKDRLLGKFKKDEDEEPVKKAAPTKFEKEHTEKSEKLISHILPMTLSALVALYAEKMFSEDYRACAPNQQEISTLLLPFFSIISRHVGIEGKASQDAIDMGAIVLAGVTIGTRMLMTAEAIRREHHANNAAPENVQDIRRAGGNSEGTGIRARGYSNEQNGAHEYPDGGSVPIAPDAGVGDGPSTAAQQVAELFRRDTAGRRAMGLAPRNLSSAN
jgi:hypothetical protein